MGYVHREYQVNDKSYYALYDTRVDSCISPLFDSVKELEKYFGHEATFEYGPVIYSKEGVIEVKNLIEKLKKGEEISNEELEKVENAKGFCDTIVFTSKVNSDDYKIFLTWSNLNNIEDAGLEFSDLIHNTEIKGIPDRSLRIVKGMFYETVLEREGWFDIKDFRKFYEDKVGDEVLSSELYQLFIRPEKDGVSVFATKEYRDLKEKERRQSIDKYAESGEIFYSNVVVDPKSDDSEPKTEFQLIEQITEKLKKELSKNVKVRVEQKHVFLNDEMSEKAFNFKTKKMREVLPVAVYYKVID